MHVTRNKRRNRSRWKPRDRLTTGVEKMEHDTSQLSHHPDKSINSQMKHRVGKELNQRLKHVYVAAHQSCRLNKNSNWCTRTAARQRVPADPPISGRARIWTNLGYLSSSCSPYTYSEKARARSSKRKFLGNHATLGRSIDP